VARVQLDAQTMRAYGEARALSAGMQLQADIVIDRPRIVDWLLEPLHALRGS
jgi:membrane fusion protein